MLNMLGKLNTENRNDNTMRIDEMTTNEMLHAINDEDKTVAMAVEKTIPQIGRLVDEILPRLLKGGRIIYIGAGTSGRLGVLDASECPPTYGVDSTLFQGIIAGGQGAMFKAVEGAEDSKTLAQDDLRVLNLNELDTVIGLAASGRTPYVIGGLIYANTVGALTGAISCVENAEISNYAKVEIEAITNAEAVMGSTRMKAGTAQKMILNMISTSLMIKYGKVYSNLMVDVQPTNEKLIERSKRIIMLATDCTPEEASHYLETSGENVKIAICMALSKKSKEECKELLEEKQGDVSQTIRILKS